MNFSVGNNVQKFILIFRKKVKAMGGRIKGKIALITGGTSGIGRATAKVLASEGASVVLAARREEKGKDVVDEIKAAGGDVIFVRTDITVNEDLDNLVKTVADKYGRIDILVNNAGTETGYSFVDLDEKRDYDRVMDTNVKAYFLLTKRVLPYMIKEGKGSIINISSVGGEIGLPNVVTYSASKGAVKMFTKALAAEVAESGVRVNMIMPGLIRTEMMDAESDFEKKYIKRVPMNRTGTPEEIAKGILFFASDDSSYCTGSAIVIDGGLLCQ